MDNFKLDLLRAQLTAALENKLVFTSVANSSFSGEINQKGDVVKLNQIGDITIGSYTSGSDITDQSLTSAQLQVTADQDKYFSFVLDTGEFNNAKSTILAEAMRKAAYAANANVDAYMAALYAEAGITQNTNDSPVDMTSLNVEDEFLTMAEKFAEAGVPREARKFAIVPPWVIHKLTLAGISSKTDNTGLYDSGFFTHALGWDFLESNNVSKNSSSWDKTRIICGVYGESLGYAAAVSGVEYAQMEARVMETKTKGRFIYGAKVVRPDMTGVLYADKTAES